VLLLYVLQAVSLLQLVWLQLLSPWLLLHLLWHYCQLEQLFLQAVDGASSQQACRHSVFAVQHIITCLLVL
jgi:hypothetical protein